MGPFRKNFLLLFTKHSAPDTSPWNDLVFWSLTLPLLSVQVLVRLVCARGGQGRATRVFLCYSLPSYPETGAHTDPEACCLTVSARLPAQFALRILPSPPHSDGVTDSHSHAQLLHGCCGFEPSSSCLQSRCFYPLSHLPAPPAPLTVSRFFETWRPAR